MATYDIRYLNTKGALAVQYQLSCGDDADAHQAALKLFANDFAKFEIWRQDACVDQGFRVPSPV